MLGANAELSKSTTPFKQNKNTPKQLDTMGQQAVLGESALNSSTLPTTLSRVGWSKDTPV